jgi:hypothetical protein
MTIMDSRKNNKLKILYIGGYGRSGSTILELILGQIDGFFPMGEVRYIWERSFMDNQLCGCGKKFKECEFWSKVENKFFADGNQINIDAILKLKYAVDRKRNIPLTILNCLKSKAYNRSYQQYSEILLELFRAVQKTSGCEVIIDSSKNPSHGYLLNSLQGIDLYILHLVRDSRATAHSWLRKKMRPEISWKKELMPIMSPGRSSIEWAVLNGFVGLMKYANANYLFVKYEDFVADPKTSITNILEFTKTRNRSLDFLDSDKFNMEVAHTVSGNPVRFNKKQVIIRPDNEWHDALPRRTKFLVTMLTWPMLMKYRYSRY